MGIGTVCKAMSQERRQIQQWKVEDSSDAAPCVFQLGEGSVERVIPNPGTRHAGTEGGLIGGNKDHSTATRFQPTLLHTSQRHLAQNFHLGSAERRGR